jgi:HD-like signal output (HDOD) protein
LPDDKIAEANIHFRILQDIARDLSGDINFPTCMDAAILVRNTLKDPQVDLERVVQVVSLEPLISSKILRLANSVSFNPAGAHIGELGNAIRRLGFETVRTTSLAVVMDQMLKSLHLVAYDRLARATWEHAIQMAAIARVLARRLGRINVDEAMLAGLVHNIGVFYLLFRAAEYPEYRDNEAATLELLSGWQESIGESLLHALGLPKEIVESVRNDGPSRNIEAPCCIRDVLYFAGLLSTSPIEWTAETLSEEAQARREADRARFADLLEEAGEDIAQLRAVLAT